MMLSLEMAKESPKGRVGGTSRLLLVAALGFITVAVTDAGLVGGHYAMKQASTRQAREQDKSFHVQVKAGETIVQEQITTNVEEGTAEILETFQGKTFVVYQDFKKGVMVVVNAERDECYVQPLNRNAAMAPELLEQYLSTHPKGVVEAVDRTEVEWAVRMRISNSSFLGQRPNDLCLGKPLYWLYPVGTQDGVRKKRETCVFSFCIYVSVTKFCINVLCF